MSIASEDSAYSETSWKVLVATDSLCAVSTVLGIVTGGIAHSLLTPGTALLGANGVVFPFVILASITNVRQGEIPLTLIWCS